MRQLLSVLIVLILLSCNNQQDTPEVSFYYWKTIFKLNQTEIAALKNNHVKNLFIRYFDVDLNYPDNKPIPISPIKFDQKPEGCNIIPVVYIKNNVMLQKGLELNELATKILSYLDQINSINKLTSNEIQIDCDWSLQSRDNFMNFIEILKKKSNKKLSVTIRLHQVKYFSKTKVPDADYGVLMYYNMGTIATDTLNSVYDRKIALRYIKSLKNYPLKLDVALPVFSQGIHIEKNKVVGLISKVNLQSFSNDSNYLQKSNNLVFVKNANIKSGYYFKQNDEIKIETISFGMLKEMAEDLKDQLIRKPKQVIFFDLDSTNLKYYQYENQDFIKITDCF